MDSQSNSINMPAVSIGGIELAPMTYQGQRVLTTALLAKEFGTDEDHILTSLARNKSRFEEGKYVFRVSGDELQSLKNSPPFRGVVGKRAPQLLLWTDHGVARLAKILESDRAWAIYERLEDTYFAVRDGKITIDALPLPQKLKAVGDVMHGFSRLAGLLGLKGNQRALSAAMATRRETGVDVLQLAGVTHLEAEVRDQFLTPTQMALRTDPTISNQRVNAILASLGLQVEHRHVRKGKDLHDYWEITDAGKDAGGDYFDTTKQQRDGTPVKQIKWPVSVIALVQSHLEGATAQLSEGMMQNLCEEIMDRHSLYNFCGASRYNGIVHFFLVIGTPHFLFPDVLNIIVPLSQPIAKYVANFGRKSWDLPNRDALKRFLKGVPQFVNRLAICCFAQLFNKHKQVGQSLLNRERFGKLAVQNPDDFAIHASAMTVRIGFDAVSQAAWQPQDKLVLVFRRFFHRALTNTEATV